MQYPLRRMTDTPSTPTPDTTRRRNWIEKLLVGAALTLLLGGGFVFLELRSVELALDTYHMETWLDQFVPFSPIWIWPYLTYFGLCFLPIVLCGPQDRFRRIALSYVLVYMPCLLCFVLLPTKMIRPELVGDGPTMDAMRWLYEIDPGYSIFPSLHVANAVLVAWIFQRCAPRWAPLLWIEAALITASTVLVRQHYLVDLPAGFALATVAYLISFRGAAEPVTEGKLEAVPEPVIATD